MFSKILIANRGEIAVRIIRTCQEMGIKTATVYSDADVDSLHVRLADEAYNIGPADATQSYLDAEKILQVAEKCGAEALHPGYGFLAENPEFDELCEQRGIIFIGPPSYCMFKAKPKHKARQLMSMLNIPVVPGWDDALVDGNVTNVKRAEDIAESIGFPVIVKPSGGGGGIGMVIAKNRAELSEAIRFVEERGRKSFGISSFYIEKHLTGIKHVEFQVLADKFGNAVHLGERDCSIQRRFQKLIEEAPCYPLSSHLRMKMGAAALDIAMALKYVNALTVEFFYLPETQEFYFNEVNSRLQVEHCVTELTTGIDIVKEQIRIAAGEPLAYTQEQINIENRAIECRITAEDAARNFLPNPGLIKSMHLPHGPNLRIDEGVYSGYTVPFYYDPLMLKVLTWGKTRNDAIIRMKRALGEMRIEGIKTVLPFHRVALEDPVFNSGRYTTDFIQKQNIIGKLKEMEKAAKAVK